MTEIREKAENYIADKSGDKKYFTIIPRMIQMTLTPVQLAVWIAIKDIAGETGECYLSTGDIATLAGVSIGTVSKARKDLIDLGFLQGKLWRDPQYPHPVWHITVPDLWAKNIEWAQKHESIQSRLDYRKSVQQVKLSPGETTPTTDENTPTADVVKEEHEEEHEEDCTPPSKSNATPIEKSDTPLMELIKAIAATCKIDRSTCSAGMHNRISTVAKKLLATGVTVDDMRKFYTWWHNSFWKGKKGQAPTPEEIGDNWGTCFSTVKPIATNGKAGTMSPEQALAEARAAVRL